MSADKTTPERHLTMEEQRIMDGALRRSVKVLPTEQTTPDYDSDATRTASNMAYGKLAQLRAALEPAPNITDPRERGIQAAIIEMSLFGGTLEMKVRKAIDRYEYVRRLAEEALQK